MIFEALQDFGLGPNTPAFWVIVVLLVVIAICARQAWHYAGKSKRLREKLESTRIDLSAMRLKADTADELKDALAEERIRRETGVAETAALKMQIEERERALSELRTRMDNEFKALTAQMLDGAHKAFLNRADETFKRYRDNADQEGLKRQKAIDDLLKPVSETLVRYERGLQEMRHEQQKSRGALQNQIGELTQSTAQVRQEAQKLATALRAGPKTRGRWGEEQLRNVVEIAGMNAYVDFTEQASHSDGDTRKQPDMIVRLPGERVVVVDSKVSLEAYLDAVEAETDEARGTHLSRHADAMWAHVQTLSRKEYAASLKDALDYVVMFVPGENYYFSALEARPQLYQDALNRKILIATPTILIAMLKSAALNWRQEKMTEHAQAVAAMAKDLYDSLRTMSVNLKKLGGALEAATKNYNATIGGYESRVLSRARKFSDYEIPGIDEAIEPMQPVEGAPREIKSAVDLLGPPDSAKITDRDDAA